MKIWYDVTNTPQVHFLLALKKGIAEKKEHKYAISCRDFSETIPLLERAGEKNILIIGAHSGGNLFNKALSLLKRFYDVYSIAPNFDISISCGSESAVWTALIKRKKSIAFGDNDLAKQWTYGKFASYAFFPDAIPERILSKQGISVNKLYRYPGYKEDIYIADYEPDVSFVETLPFDRYVVVRPENLQANYIRNNNVKSITPELLKKLTNRGYNVLYLPRYQIDYEYGKDLKGVYTPSTPVNGLDACYFSDAVLTGAGTFAREASCLGVPSFSFFAGKRLLAVDRSMIDKKMMMFSRDVDSLVEAVTKSERKEVSLSRSKEVKKVVITKLIEVIEGWS